MRGATNPQNGYQSDYDLLIIVSHEKLTDIADYWYVAEDKILRDPLIARPVNIIVHTMQEVNDAPAKGQYFFTDITRDGVVLYELPGHPPIAPRPPTAKAAYDLANAYFDQQLPAIGRYLKLAEVSQMKGELTRPGSRTPPSTSNRRRDFLRVPLASPDALLPALAQHQVLGSLAEQSDARSIEAWPRSEKADRKRFELLKRAYVEARYSSSYEISREDLEGLFGTAERLRDIVLAVSKERLEQLRSEGDL